MNTEAKNFLCFRFRTGDKVETKLKQETVENVLFRNKIDFEVLNLNLESTC